MSFRMMSVVEGLVQCSPRQFEGETKAARYMMNFLTKKGVPFTTRTFTVDLPKFISGTLRADGKPVVCAPCSMVGGKITSKANILSSRISSSVLQDEPNINFNPSCSTISCSNHYFAPALAVDPKGLQQIIRAKKIEGEVKVKKVKHTSMDILVGNRKNPKTIVFAHYDSINTGAIDNASGVATMVGAFLEKPQTLGTTLYIIAGNEELSYDKPVYWGHGFRMFESTYRSLMEGAQKIIAIDCVGNGTPLFSKNPNFIRLGFPIKNLETWVKKIEFITADFEHLMTVYHSAHDDGRGMKESWMVEAKDLLLGRIAR